MIPDEIHNLLHEIRLIGGGIRKYEHPDDWQLIRNLIGDRYNVDLADATPAFWDQIKQALTHAKENVQKIMDERFNKGLHHYNPFI